MIPNDAKTKTNRLAEIPRPYLAGKSKTKKEK